MLTNHVYRNDPVVFRLTPEHLPHAPRPEPGDNVLSTLKQKRTTLLAVYPCTAVYKEFVKTPHLFLGTQYLTISMYIITYFIKK